MLPSVLASVLTCLPQQYSCWPAPDQARQVNYPGQRLYLQSYPLCGLYHGLLFHVTAPECFDELPLTECGVTASTALDSDHLPGNVLLEGEAAWAPAIRAGNGWQGTVQ